MFYYIIRSPMTYKEMLIRTEEPLDISLLLDTFFENSEPSWNEKYNVTDFFWFIKNEVDAIEVLNHSTVSMKNKQLVEPFENFLDIPHESNWENENE